MLSSLDKLMLIANLAVYALFLAMMAPTMIALSLIYVVVTSILRIAKIGPIFPEKPEVDDD